MSKPGRTSGRNSRFYRQAAEMEEVRTGYLFKSPPYKRFKSVHSWKRRFFVLFKMSADTYHLNYFKNEKKRDKPLGDIDMSQVFLMSLCPESHAMWGWIHDTFRCSTACVLFIKVAKRDFFLIAENSWEADSWLSVLFKAQKNPRQKWLDPEESRKNRPVSLPPTPIALPGGQSCAADKDQEAGWRPLERNSAPPFSHYDYPRSYRDAAQAQPQKSEDEEEEEEEGEKNENYYMTMGKVYEALEEKKREEQEEEDFTNSQKTLDTADRHTRKSLEDLENFRQKGLDTADSHTSKSLENLENFRQKGLDTADSHTSKSLQNFENFSQKCLYPADRHSKSLAILENFSQKGPVEKEVCVSPDDLWKHLTIGTAAGTPCVSDWTKLSQTGLFHRGDLILAINDLHIDSVAELHMYLNRLRTNEVKVTIQRLPWSQPLHSDPCP